MAPTGFSLTKWYMDCIDRQGNTIICYAAFIRWKEISFNYSSSLLWQEGTGTNTSTSLVRVKPPGLAGDEMIWISPGLKVQGKWKKEQESISAELYSGEKGSVQWFCIMPKAITEVSVKGLALNGYGYVEKLEMSLKPWDMPVNAIRWGRFIADGCSIVWIVWEGDMPLCKVWLNGKETNSAEVTDQYLQIDDHGRLEFFESVVLREGPVISTAFARMKWLHRFFPPNVLNTFECKWRSRAAFRANTETCTGWAIHEVVKWH
jgi:hypothetical protein